MSFREEEGIPLQRRTRFSLILFILVFCFFAVGGSDATGVQGATAQGIPACAREEASGDVGDVGTMGALGTVNPWTGECRGVPRDCDTGGGWTI